MTDIVNLLGVVACVDRSSGGAGVTDYAAWAAGRAGVPLEVLPVTRQGPGELQAALLGNEERALHLVVVARPGAEGVGALARTAERLAHTLKAPMLLVPDAFATPQRVLIGFVDGFVSRRCVEIIQDAPLFASLSLSLLLTGRARSESRRKLGWASKELASAGFEVETDFRPGDAATALAHVVEDRAIDLVVLYVRRPSFLRRLFSSGQLAGLLQATGVPTLVLHH